MRSDLKLLEKLWKGAKFKPNESQKEAILHTEGPLFLPAGPGSGKTRVLLWRVINLVVNHGVAPEEIYLSTFTEKAALQLRDGLRAMLGAVTAVTNKPYDLSKMYVGTVHSLCQRLLADRRFIPDRHRARPPVVKDELAQYIFIRRRSNWKSILKAGGLEKYGNRVINEMFEAGGSNSRRTSITNLMLFSIACLRRWWIRTMQWKRKAPANLKKAYVNVPCLPRTSAKRWRT